MSRLEQKWTCEENKRQRDERIKSIRSWCETGKRKIKVTNRRWEKTRGGWRWAETEERGRDTTRVKRRRAWSLGFTQSSAVELVVVFSNDDILYYGTVLQNFNWNANKVRKPVLRSWYESHWSGRIHSVNVDLMELEEHVSGSPASAGYILWEPWTSLFNSCSDILLTSIHVTYTRLHILTELW